KHLASAPGEQNDDRGVGRRWPWDNAEITPISDHLTDSIFSVASLLRWRMGLEGPHAPYNPAGFYWSRVSSPPIWQPIPMEVSVSTSISAVPQVDSEIRLSVVELADAKATEPLAH